MADLATLQTWLTEAELAYHKLATGSQEEAVQHDGMSLTYTRADLGRLKNYIGDLKSQIAAITGSGLKRRGFVVDL